MEIFKLAWNLFSVKGRFVIGAYLVFVLYATIMFFIALPWIACASLIIGGTAFWWAPKCYRDNIEEVLADATLEAVDNMEESVDTAAERAEYRGHDYGEDSCS